MGDLKMLNPRDDDAKWIAEVDLDTGADFRVGFVSQSDADAYVMQILHAGFVIHDQSDNAANKYDTIFYPIHRVRALRVFAKE